jgi:hypothetical protein
MDMHPLHQLLCEPNKTDAEKAACQAFALACTMEGFTHLTPEEVFDKLLAQYEEIAVVPQGI